MFKITNALIIDDKIDLTTEDGNEETENSDYQSLRNLQKYFLKNSIPFSVVNQLSESFSAAIILMRAGPRPDLVVLDLDLDSNGTIDEADISLIRIILNNLTEQFGDFILMIYSSQSDYWEEVKKDLLESDAHLSKLLSDENVIVSEKFFKSDEVINEKLGAEIKEKQAAYFSTKIKKVDNFFRSNWNNEVAIICFMFVMFNAVLYYSFADNSSIIFVAVSVIMTLTTLSYIAIHKSRINRKDENN